MTRLLLFALLLVAAACGDADYRPNASGLESDVQVVVDSMAWNGIVGEALRGEIESPIATLPAPERAFDARPATITSQPRFEEIKQFKNIVIAAPLSDTTVEARIIKAYFSDDAQQQLRATGRGAVVNRVNLWRRQQQVVFVTAPNDSLLAETIRARGRQIRGFFNEMIRVRMEEDMFERRRQVDIEEQLMARHGFAVNVQHDYFIARDTTRFVWLRRVLTDTWRSQYVYWIDNFDPRRLDSAYVVGLRDSLTSVHVTSTAGGYVQIDQRLPLEVRPTTFLGRENAWEMRGVWAMMRPREDGTPIATMAGPFVNYTFYDPATRRLYTIDGMIFAPGPKFSKLEFLRQMEVIAHTFRTREDVAAAAQAER